jgi:CHASE3 domain sensor protein
MIKELQQLGEKTVKTRLLNGDYGQPLSINYECVNAWLSSTESERADARAEESLSISRKALRNSKWATVIAIIAIVLSTMTAIIIAWFQGK